MLSWRVVRKAPVERRNDIVEWHPVGDEQVHARIEDSKWHQIAFGGLALGELRHSRCGKTEADALELLCIEQICEQVVDDGFGHIGEHAYGALEIAADRRIPDGFLRR